MFVCLYSGGQRVLRYKMLLERILEGGGPVEERDDIQAALESAPP